MSGASNNGETEDEFGTAYKAAAERKQVEAKKPPGQRRAQRTSNNRIPDAQPSLWCEVSYAGGEGWAYSDYLIAEYQGAPAVVTERRADIGVPVVEYRSSGGGALAGGATGAVAGALIGGPVGAAVGAVAGAATGGFTEGALAPEARTYVMENPGETVYLDGEVVVGAQVPETVEVREIPNYEYRYVYVNQQPVIVEPGTRRIVYIVR